MPTGLPLPTADLQLFPMTGTSWSAHLPRCARPRDRAWATHSLQWQRSSSAGTAAPRRRRDDTRSSAWARSWPPSKRARGSARSARANRRSPSTYGRAE